MASCALKCKLKGVASTEQGATDKLAKIWMPLAEFTSEAMAGLTRGDLQIPVGGSKESFEKFEKGKMEIIQQKLSAMK